MKKAVLFILTLLVFACNDKKQAQTNEQALNISNELVPKMSIQKLPDTKMVAHNVTGNFKKHPEVIENLRAYLVSNGIEGTKCIGVYPSDPDAVKGEDLNWKIGFEVSSEITSIESDMYNLETLKGETALIVESSVKNATTHGVYSEIWLLEHNYVQVQPSRMLYHFDSDNPEEQSTTIIYPVKKRTRNIPVITIGTLNHKL